MTEVKYTPSRWRRLTQNNISTVKANIYQPKWAKLKSPNTSHPLDSTNNSFSPTEASRVNPNRTLGYLTTNGVMPAPVLGAHSAVKRRVLILVYLLQPGTAYKRRVEEEVHFLAVVEGLRVEVSVSLVVSTIVSFLCVRSCRTHPV